MDVKKIKVELAGLLSLMEVLYPLTGSLPPYPQNIRANAQAPFSLAETDLPTWIIFTGGASYPSVPDQTEGRLLKETRDFICCLYVCNSQMGIDGEAERRVEPYLDTARALIQSHPLLYDGNISERVAGIMRAYLIKDDGVVVLPYGNQKQMYDGLRFTIRVEGLNDSVYYNE